MTTAIERKRAKTFAARRISALPLQVEQIAMTTTTIKPLRLHRTAIQTGTLVGLAILFVTHDPSGVIPHVLLGLAFVVAVHGYLRSRPRRPWDCNDEP